ncbi:MAG: hypothetical protein ACR2ME_10095 [Acidimicrobiia bacterium]
MKTPVAAGIVAVMATLAVVLSVAWLADSNDPKPFDIDAFLESKLKGALEPDADRIGVVALVPAEAELTFDRKLGPQEIAEFEGYTYVLSEMVASLARTFAEANDTDLLGAIGWPSGSFPVCRQPHG